MKIDDWRTCYLRQKWKWASRVAQCTDNRWSQQVLHRDQGLTHNPTKFKNRRSHGRPKTRWIDVIKDFFRLKYGMDEEDRLIIAVNQHAWDQYENKFIEYANID